MQFVLTKNKQSAVAHIILERIIKNFEEVKITPSILKGRLRIEYGIYDEKEQEKLKTKYLKIFEQQYQKFIPNGNKTIFVKIKIVEEGIYFNFKTEKDKKTIKIQVNKNGYLKITNI